MNRSALKNEVYMKTRYSQYKESILKKDYSNANRTI